MQELEKILEEIEQIKARAEKLIVKPPHDKLDQVANDTAETFIEAYKECQDIIRKHIKNEEDILKFYLCESEDDYYLGQRVQNMYYAKYGSGGFTWFMSRYLPWGTDGYPSEPKEIPFMEWIEGFISKHMNDGWIPVEKELPPEPPEYVDDEDDLEEYIVMIDGAIRPTILRYAGDGTWWEDGTYYQVIAWQSMPEPYRTERSEGE